MSTQDETDTLPTPPPWHKGITSSEERRIAVMRGEGGQKVLDIYAEQPLKAGEAEANADLFIATGQSAHEVTRRDYDPVAAVEQLPAFILAAEEALTIFQEKAHSPPDILVDALNAARANA